MASHAKYCVIEHLEGLVEEAQHIKKMDGPSALDPVIAEVTPMQAKIN